MKMSCTCQIDVNIISYANVETIFKEWRAPNKGFVYIGMRYATRLD